MSAFWQRWLALALAAVWVLWGTRLIPFHPDETSWLTMAADVGRPLTEVAWSPAWPNTLEYDYRLLNAPLTKYVLAGAWWVSGQPLPTDWNWSASWEANLAQGSYPSETLLRLARLSMALVLVVGVAALGRAAQRQGGTPAAVLAMLLLAAHPLVLLHGRRAMAEGVLLTATCCVLWALALAPRHPAWAGLATALALSAKQSLLPLAGVLALAWCWPVRQETLKRLAVWGLASALAFAVLNPLYWRDPVGALVAAAQARQQFSVAQGETVRRLAPEQALASLTEKSTVWLAQAFFLPPAFYDVGNYVADTTAQTTAYQARLGHMGWGVVGSGVLLTWQVGRRARAAQPVWMLWGVTVGLIGVVVIPASVIYQRYTLAVVPVFCLWVALVGATLWGRLRPHIAPH